MRMRGREGGQPDRERARGWGRWEEATAVGGGDGGWRGGGGCARAGGWEAGWTKSGSGRRAGARGKGSGNWG